MTTFTGVMTLKPIANDGTGNLYRFLIYDTNSSQQVYVYTAGIHWGRWLGRGMRPNCQMLKRSYQVKTRPNKSTVTQNITQFFPA